MSRVISVAAPLSQLRQHFLQRLQRQHHGAAELDETGACLRRVLRVPGQPIFGGALIIIRPRCRSFSQAASSAKRMLRLGAR